MEDKKMQVSQDYLYQYLNAHDVKLSRLAELMNVSSGNLSAYFLHLKDNHGNPRRLGPAHVDKLNLALPILANELQGCVMTFGSNQVRTSRVGNTYDPALIQPLKRVGCFLNLSAITRRLLGWTVTQKSARLVQKSSMSYGNITLQDMMKVNAELLSIAAVLNNINIMYNSNTADSSSSSTSNA